MDELFTAIESLVKEVTASPFHQYLRDDSLWSQWSATFNQTVAEFFQRSYNTISRIPEQIQVTRFVHELQGKFNDLVEQLFKYSSPSGAPQHGDPVYEKVCSVLSTAIDGFSQWFGNFFNPQATLPYTHSLIVSTQLSRTAREIKERFSSTQVNKHLLLIALKPLVRRGEDPTGITYYELNYLRSFSADLKQLRNQVNLDTYSNYGLRILSNQLKEIPFNEAKINVLLNVLLMHYNFNSPEYISFCIASLMDKINTLPTPEDKIKVLRLYFRIMQQVILRPGASLERGDQPPANQQMMTVIEAEITYQESRVGAKNDGRTFEKVDTTFSSYELAVFVELLIESKIIKDTNRSKVNRVMAGAFNTEGTDAVSPESLRTKSVNMKSSAVDSVKNKIIKCLEIIRSW